MFKKTYSVLFLALICVLSLAVFAFSACGDGNNSGGLNGGSGGVSNSGLDSDSGDSSSGGSAERLCADGNHDFGDFIVQIQPNCYRAGAEYRVCGRCNLREYRDLAKTDNHVEETIAAVAATCASNGLTEGKRCAVCGEVFVLQQSVARIPHTEKVIPAKAATCTEFGYTEGKECAVCGEIIEKPTFIDDGHSYYAYDDHCRECGALKPAKHIKYSYDEETDGYIITEAWDGSDCIGIPMYYEGKPVTKIGERVYSGKLYELDIPSTVIEIGKEAFANCTELTKVRILGEARIGENAFEGSEIATVEMPKVTYIGRMAFRGCNSLESIKGITASVIAESAFENCLMLKSIEFCEGVTEIKDEAFVETSLESMVIPSSVTRISRSALPYDYQRKKITVYYKGSEQELEEKPQVKDGLSGVAAIYYYSETEPEVNENGEYNGNFWRYDKRNSIIVWKKQ